MAEETTAGEEYIKQELTAIKKHPKVNKF